MGGRKKHMRKQLKFSVIWNQKYHHRYDGTATEKELAPPSERNSPQSTVTYRNSLERRNIHPW